jgi:MFS family permease
VTAFIAAGVTGARLATSFGVKRLLVVGMTLGALGMAWLTRVPPGANYLTDLLPALLLAGLAIGLCAPAVQIGALSGVSGRSVGLASGLVETMREIGGAVGIAAASTVLVGRISDASEITAPAARETAAFAGFQSAFTVTLVMATLGVLIAAIAFPRVRHSAVLSAGESDTSTKGALESAVAD